MIRVSDQPNLTDDQIRCVLDFAVQVAGERSALRDIKYTIIGIADLAQEEDARALLRSLEAEDWDGAAQHRELAGANNLLMAMLLHIDVVGQRSHDYWIAVRSPFEYLESASTMACGKISRPPKDPMSILSLENARERKG